MRSIFVLALLLNVSFFASNALAQQGESSRREATVIESVRSVGGRVTKIAANTDDREVSFSLLGDKIKDEQVKDVAVIENVIWLNLGGTGVTDRAVEAIKSMKLQKLYLQNTAVTNAALKSVAEMKSLTYLNLYGSKVTDDGLAYLEGLENLQQLHLWQTEVTQKAADQLRKKLPQLMVTGFPEPPVNSSPIQSPAKKDNAEAIEEEPATDASDANEQTSEKKPAESKRAKE